MNEGEMHVELVEGEMHLERVSWHSPSVVDRMGMFNDLAIHLS